MEQMANTRLCPVCGGDELVSDCRSITATIKGQQITVLDIRAEFAPGAVRALLTVKTATATARPWHWHIRAGQ